MFVNIGVWLCVCVYCLHNCFICRRMYGLAYDVYYICFNLVFEFNNRMKLVSILVLYFVSSILLRLSYCWYVLHFLHPFIYWLIIHCLFSDECMMSFIHSLLHPSIYSLIYSFVHLFISSFIDSLIHYLIPDTALILSLYIAEKL